MPTYVCRKCQKPLTPPGESKVYRFSEGKKVPQMKRVNVTCKHCGTTNMIEVPK